MRVCGLLCSGKVGRAGEGGGRGRRTRGLWWVLRAALANHSVFVWLLVDLTIAILPLRVCTGPVEREVLREVDGYQWSEASWKVERVVGGGK